MTLAVVFHDVGGRDHAVAVEDEAFVLPGDLRPAQPVVALNVATSMVPPVDVCEASMPRPSHPRAMLTARATMTASVANESRFSAAMTSLARRVYGMASVGEKAIELVSDT